MYAIEEGLKVINHEKVDTFQRDVEGSKTQLQVEAGTTGFKGGCCRDTGGRTYLRVACEKGDFLFEPEENGFTMACCGDDALSAVLKVLDFAQQVLRDQCCDVDD